MQKLNLSAMKNNPKDSITLLLVLLHITLLMGILSCEKKEMPKYDRTDYTIIEVHHYGEPVALVGAVPGDTVQFGDYTIMCHRRVR